jgi:DNA-binding protein
MVKAKVSEEIEEREEVETAKDNRDDTVFIGKKPVMAYVMAVLERFGRGADKVSIKARGRSISAAVDVTEIVRNRFLKDVKVKNVVLSTEQLKREGERTSNVSSIEIFLVK